MTELQTPEKALTSTWRPALATAVVTIVWVGLQVRRPELTYHFAPLIAAAAWPVMLRREGQREISEGVVAGGLSALLVSIAGIGLAITNNLEGPTLWHSGPAWVEAVLFAAIAAAIGARVATSERVGFLGSLVARD